MKIPFTLAQLSAWAMLAVLSIPPNQLAAAQQPLPNENPAGKSLYLPEKADRVPKDNQKSSPP